MSVDDTFDVPKKKQDYFDIFRAQLSLGIDLWIKALSAPAELAMLGARAFYGSQGPCGSAVTDAAFPINRTTAA
jgi:hypothetical protein